jgi:branched-chain amino acid transport system permease protein
MVYMSASLGVAVSIPLVLLMTVLLGVLIERAAYKPLRSAPRMSVMISAIGVSYLLENLATYITGGLAKAYPEIPFLKTTYTIGSMTVKTITIVTPLLTILLVIAGVLVYAVAAVLLKAVSKEDLSALLRRKKKA